MVGMELGDLKIVMVKKVEGVMVSPKGEDIFGSLCAWCRMVWPDSTGDVVTTGC